MENVVLFEKTTQAATVCYEERKLKFP